MSVEADIGQKIMEAIDHYRQVADDANAAADEIDHDWSENDWAALAERGVITKREAGIMLGVIRNGRKSTSRNARKRTSRRAR